MNNPSSHPPSSSSRSVRLRLDHAQRLVGIPFLPLFVSSSLLAVFTMVASEHKISEQWDEAIETGIKRMAYGLAGGAVAALVLFRT